MGLYADLDDTGAAAWFHDCFFRENRAPTSGEVAVQSPACRVYSNTRLPTVYDRSLDREISPWHLSPLAPHESPASQPDVFGAVADTGQPFLRPSDAFFQRVRSWIPGSAADGSVDP